MKRPYLITSREWTGSGVLDLRLRFPYEYFRLPDVARRIAGFEYWRGTLVLTFKINATKFHYGRLCAAVIPFGHFGGSFTETIEQTNFANNMTALPHITLSASDSTPSTLVLPFLYPFNFYRIPSDSANRYLYIVRIFEMAPLRLGTTVPPATVSIFAHCSESHLTGLFPAPAASYTAQSKKGRRRPRPSVVNEEGVERSEEKVVSSTISNVARVVASYLHIPPISQPLALAARILGTGASFFEGIGLCKPNDVSSVQPVVQHSYNFANGMGLEQASTLGFDPENTVGAMSDVMGTSDDDMLISSLVKIPTLFQRFRWSTDDLTGAYVVIPVYPLTSFYYVSLPPSRMRSMLEYISSPFQYWRGSIKFTVEVVCSNFHSGRLSLAWIPSPADANTVITEQSTVERIIMDLQEQQTVVAQIPYLKDAPWLPCVAPNLASTALGTNGYFVVSVLNPLTEAANGANEAYINVWVSGGEDFQLACPRDDVGSITDPMPLVSFVPISDVPLTVPSDPIVYPYPQYEAQGLTSTDRMNLKATMFGKGSLLVDRNVCMGENFVHVKQLLCRPTRFHNNFSILQKWGFQTLISSRSLLSYFSRVFLGKRGSIVIKAVPNSPPGFGTYQSLAICDSLVLNDVMGGGSVVQTQPINATLEASLPYYNVLLYNPTFLVQDYSTRIRVLNNDTNIIDFTGYSSAGDDFTCGGIFGFPNVSNIFLVD